MPGTRNKLSAGAYRILAWAHYFNYLIGVLPVMEGHKRRHYLIISTGWRVRMGVRVLVAEEDLNLNMLVHDILEILFRDVIIDRALNYESLLDKISKSEEPYDLILYDVKFDAEDGNDALAGLRSRFPHYDEHIVVLADSTEDFEACGGVQGLRSIMKPFSLDDFSEVVRQVCVS